MRKQLLFFSFILWSSLAFSCDFCNCYLGINPHYKKNTVGLRLTNTAYSGSLLNNSELALLDLTAQDFSETYSTMEAYSQFYPIQKLQVQIFVPYVIKTESMSDAAFRALTQQQVSGSRISHTDPTHKGVVNDVKQATTIQGFGDPMLILNYQLFNLNAMDTTKIKQRMFAGAGVKFPMGKSKFDETKDPLEKKHQPGTGSWDFIGSVSYLARYKKLGANLNFSYMLNLKDKQAFKYANRSNVNLSVYRELSKNSLFVYPSLGLFYEQAGRDNYKSQVLEQTGGQLLLAHTGLDIYYRKFSISTAFHFPTVQKLFGSQPNLNYRIIAGIGFAIN